MNLTGRRV